MRTLVVLLALASFDSTQSRSPSSPCNPYSEYCSPQLGSNFVDGGAGLVNGFSAAGLYAGNDTQAKPTVSGFVSGFDGGVTVSGNNFAGTVTLKNGSGNTISNVSDPVFLLTPGVAFDGGFVCLMQWPQGFSGSINATENAWATVVQDGGCWLYNGTRSSSSAPMAPPVVISYFLIGQ